MLVKRLDNADLLAYTAAQHAATVIRTAVEQHGQCRIVVATGASQFPFLEKLTSRNDLDWSKVEPFHLDEYVGLPMTHPGSFRKMLMERVVRPTGMQKYNFVEGDAADLPSAVREIGTRLNSAPIDLAFVGIGENSHIAFNDPPADFETDEPYIVVNLDEACRRQQVGEGWFASLEQVPSRAVSMSPRQILKAREIIAVVPDLRKAPAVKKCLQAPVSPAAPASILREHSNTTLYLDRNSASLLEKGLLHQLERGSAVRID